MTDGKDALLHEFRQADTETNQANKALVLKYQTEFEGALSRANLRWLCQQ
jgi:hypothetical protein